MSDTKHCNRCNISKPLSAYYKRRNNGKPTAYCKPCQMAQAVERQRNLKTQCVNYKGGKCERCGYRKYYGALEFHHKDPKEKDFNISQASSRVFNDKHKVELDKCALLCANCHKEVHAELRENAPWLSEIRDSKELKKRRAERTKVTQERLKKVFCIDCCKQISLGSVRCRSCDKTRPKPHLEKIDWPTTSKLLERVQASSYSAVARELGVSDNAIRKRIKTHPE